MQKQDMMDVGGEDWCLVVRDKTQNTECFSNNMTFDL